MTNIDYKIYQKFIEIYRSMLIKYKMLSELEIDGKKESSKYKKISYELIDLLKIEKNLLNDKIEQLQGVNEYVCNLILTIRNVELIFLQDSEETLILRICNKLSEAILNDIFYKHDSSKKNQEKKVLQEKFISMDNELLLFNLMILSEEINNKKELHTKMILNKFRYYEIFTSYYLDNIFVSNNFDFSVFDKDNFYFIYSNENSIKEYRNHLIVDFFVSNIKKILNYNDEILDTEAGKAIIIYLISRLKTYLLLLDSETIIKLNYDYHKSIEENNLKNKKIQKKISKVFTNIDKDKKIYQKKLS